MSDLGSQIDTLNKKVDRLSFRLDQYMDNNPEADKRVRSLSTSY